MVVEDKSGSGALNECIQSIQEPLSVVRDCEMEARFCPSVEDQVLEAADHCTEAEAEDNDPEIPEDEYPSWYKEGHYDAAILYSEASDKDKYEAECLKHLIEEVVNLGMKDYPHPKVLTHELRWTDSKLMGLEMLVEHSTFIFLYVTDDFICDTYCLMQKDEVVMSSIDDLHNRWKVIPVLPPGRTKNLPMGIKSLHALPLARLCKGHSSVVEALEIAKENGAKQDRYFVPNLERLFKDKFHLRRQREDKAERQLKLWKKGEVERRAQTRKTEGKDIQERESRKWTRQTGSGQATTVIINAQNIQIGDNNTQITDGVDGLDAAESVEHILEDHDIEEAINDLSLDRNKCVNMHGVPRNIEDSAAGLSIPGPEPHIVVEVTSESHPLSQSLAPVDRVTLPAQQLTGLSTQLPDTSGCARRLMLSQPLDPAGNTGQYMAAQQAALPMQRPAVPPGPIPAIPWGMSGLRRQGSLVHATPVLSQMQRSPLQSVRLMREVMAATRMATSQH